jgi:Cell division protein CrgA
VPESKNTNDTTDEAVEPVESTDQTDDTVDEVVEEDADAAGTADRDVSPATGDDDVEGGELVDVPEELAEDSDDSEETEETEETDAGTAEVPAAVGATSKADKAAKDKKPGKPGKAVKPPRVKKAEKAKKSGPAPRKIPKQRRWVAPLMLACWLIGLAWLVVFYVAGSDIPYMRDLNNWNLLIGMALIAVGFVVSTQWV